MEPVSRQQAIALAARAKQRERRLISFVLGSMILLFALAFLIPILLVKYNLLVPRQAGIPLMFILCLMALVVVGHVEKAAIRRMNPECSSCGVPLDGGHLLPIAIASGKCGQCGGRAFVDE